MKTTGIYRRIDGLGRVVIPKEIRKTLNIKEGDPMEIFINRNEIVMRKYNVSIGLSELILRLYNEFSNVESDIEKETANKINKHINALQELLRDIEKH